MVEPHNGASALRILEGRVERLEQATDTSLKRVEDGLGDVGTELKKVQSEVADLRTDFRVAEATRIAKARRSATFAGGTVSAIVVGLLKVVEMVNAG